MANIVITIPASSRVFLLEDSLERISWFSQRIPNLTIRSTAESAIECLVTNEPFDFVFLDHDLGILDSVGIPIGGVGDGKQVAKHLATTGFLGKNVVIHSWNEAGSSAMAGILKGAFVMPFGKFEIKNG